MTIKKQKILDAALQLFATHGYDATPTSKIAKEAGVSEGLIFRHFESKEKLLVFIMDMGIEKSLELSRGVLSAENPKEILKGILELPFLIEEDIHFWKLHHALKLQSPEYTDRYKTFKDETLLEIFSKLGYKNPRSEAAFMGVFLEGLFVSILSKQEYDYEQLKQIIYSKYNLNE